MPRIASEHLIEIAREIFKTVGVSENVAELVSDSLVESNMRGVDSHGVMRLPAYVRLVEEGKIRPDSEPVVIRETVATAVVDGRWGFGQVVARRAMEIAVEKARQCGAAAVGVIHCNHIGRLGEYSQMAAEENMIGMIMCNSGPYRGGPGGFVAPYGGRGRVFSTNPLSVALPTGRGPPFVLDFSTSKVAEGKIRLARKRGEKIPEGWIVDKHGRPSTNPDDLYDGGAILPIAEHKGYGLAMLIDILSAPLTGAYCTSSPKFEGGNPLFIQVVDIQEFTSLREFKEKVGELVDKVRSTPLANGFDRILIPGEPELIAREKRLRTGIDVPEETWEEIVETAKRIGATV